MRPESYAAGVSCESCHGPAASWEFTHFSRSAKKSPDLLNLADLSVRATACAQCHIGPQTTDGKTYDVIHDLIAAGHPRLTFEFEAQLANLPAHWNKTKNVKSHFEAWRIGELAIAAQQVKLNAARPAFEFASLRCFDCHHRLTLKPAAERISSPPYTGISPQERRWLTELSTTKHERAMLLRRLLDNTTAKRATGSAGTRWEQHVQLSLALAAYSADYPQDRELASNTEDLADLLANSFRIVRRERNLWEEKFFAGGPYDSPSAFDPNPNEAILKQVLEKIRTRLTSP